MLRRLPDFAVLFCLGAPALAQQDAASSTASAPTTATPTADALRATIRGAIAWIGQQTQPVADRDDAALLPMAEGQRQRPQTNVYGGGAGVLIFLENAAKVLGDPEASALADELANGLRSERREDRDGQPTWTRAPIMGRDGLYVGDAGVGQAFLVRARLRSDDAAMATAVEIGDALLQRARSDGELLSWDHQTDIISGAAGIALFLLELGEAGKQQRFVDAARKVGHWLVAEAVTVPSLADAKRTLPTWPMQMGSMRRHMPGFSHGTAGIAYALARIGQATQDQALRDASKGGANWLLEHAVEDGEGTKWAALEGQQYFMGGWCHGPAGTARLFLYLHALTGDDRYRTTARRGAQFVVDYAAAAERGSGDGKRPYVPPSYCCGVAGVVEFFCDLHRVTGDADHAAFARKAAAYLLEVAIRDGASCKWQNGQSAPGGPVASNASACNLDLMLGAAGEALALLHVLLLDDKEQAIVGLPDRAVAPQEAR